MDREAAADYLRNIHRRSVTGTFLVALATYVGLVTWGSRAAAKGAWLLGPSCDAACARSKAGIGGALLLVFGNAALALLWGFGFYRLNAAAAPPKARRAMLVEAVLLTLVGAALVLDAVRAAARLG